MTSSAISLQINILSQELSKKKDLLSQITDAMEAVNSAWASVGDTGYENSFNYIKNNSNNYWNVLNKSGIPCGDVVSFCDSLDVISKEISEGEVTSAMGDVMAKAAEKIAELEAEIATLEDRIATLETQYAQALAEEKAAAEALKRAEAQNAKIN